MGLRSSPGVDRLGRPEKGCTSLTPCKAQAALPNQPSLAWFGWLLAIKKKRFGWLLAGFWLASGWLSVSPFLNSLQGPCQISPLLPGLAGFWLSKKKVWLASGWLLAGFWLACLEKSCTYLAETGWTFALPGGGLVEALPLAQTKQSTWHNSTRGLAKQPRRRSPWTSRKRLHFLTPCKAQAALPNQPSLAWFGWLLAIKKKRFGWLLAGFWLAFWLGIPLPGKSYLPG